MLGHQPAERHCIVTCGLVRPFPHRKVVFARMMRGAQLTNATNSLWMTCPTKSTTAEVGLLSSPPSHALNTTTGEHRRRIEERPRETEHRAAVATQLPRLSAWGN